MSQIDFPADTPWPPSLALHVERVCNAFEAAWQGGLRPRLETYLGDTPEPDHAVLLSELLALDLEYRRKNGDDPTPEEYQRHFPAHADLIEALFRQPTPPAHRSANAAANDNGDTPDLRPIRAGTPSGCTADSAANGPASAFPVVPGYEIEGVLGRGGMGVVYRARQAGTKRLVALKMIRSGPDASPDELDLMRAEAEAVARFHHPHIVQIFEVGEYQGMPFLALEFVNGGTLAQRLAGNPQLPGAAAATVETLARAMHYAHARGIVHRDLKPVNILLAFSREPPASAEPALAGGSRLNECVPKITDFGLAKRLDDVGSTLSGVLKGTPSYMAPEQARGHAREIGPAVDIHALGVILYEMLTGRPAFKGTTILDTLEQVCSREPAPPSRLQPGVPRDLETICLKCLEKDRRRRYATAEALAEDLRRFLNREPIRARATPSWERLGKWARRKPAAAGFVGAALLAASALVAFMALYALYASQQAGIYQHELQTIREQQEVRERTSQTLLRAQQHEAAGQWTAAGTELASAQEALDALPDLGANELRADVRRRLAVVRQRLREQEQRQQAQRRFQDFQGPYDDALFYYTQFTGQDLANSQARTRSAIRTALAIYGLERAAEPAGRLSPLLEDDRTFLRAAEHAQLAGACYELLLLGADTEAATPPGQVESKAQGRKRAEKALALLTRAARLGQAYGLETRTYHLRTARYTAQSKGEPVDPAALAQAAPAGPASVLDWFLEGLDHYRQEHFEQARQACAEVLRKQESHFWGRYVEALCNLRLGRWVQAKAELTVCVNRRPELAWPRLLRGFAASELGFAHANKDLAAEEFRAAEEDFDLVLTQSRDLMVQYVGLANRGVLNVRRQRWAEAVADLQQAVQVNPAAFPAYLNLAQALQGAGKGDKALAALDQAIQRAPNLAMLYQSRAGLHKLHKHWAAARADFEQAIALEPRGSTSDLLITNLVELGQVLHRERKYPEALARFNLALRLKPTFVLTERFRAETLLALNRPAEAGKALDRYLAVTRNAGVKVYQARGLIYATTRQLSAAIAMYTLALQQNPADTATRCLRGWAYLLTDATRLALEDFDTCLKVDPTSADALIGRADARIRLRRLAAALDDVKAAAKQGKLTDRLLYNLSCVYAQGAGHLEAEARTAQAVRAQAAVLEAAYFKTVALDYLSQAMEKLPSERRAAFWRTQVQADPALSILRDGSSYAQLAARYAGARP